MNKNKFTPGPWTIEYTIREKYHLGQLRKADSSHIVVGANLPLAELHLGNVNANAYLIAAAPEMYDEIESALTEIENFGENLHERLACVENLRAVLAKARGEI